ncbi:hypothetical protein WMY93_003078 [Mugilogobius chulae]|uniref:Ig-like domain-containing protein n=1 Tax=Mugilogobius chulae TaxID=88201 RepID=A0AAW0PYW8_9GOBI
MSCITSGFTMTSYYMHWIRQKPGQGLEWIGELNSGSGATTYASAFQSRFTLTENVPSSSQYMEITGPVDSVELLQPGSVLLQPAHTLTTSCQVSGYSLTDDSYATGWIRQREGKLQWIFYQWGSSSGSFYQNDALKNKFSFSRDMSAGTVTIQGQSLQSEDSGVYFCVREHSDSEQQHSCTKTQPNSEC